MWFLLLADIKIAQSYFIFLKKSSTVYIYKMFCEGEVNSTAQPYSCNETQQVSFVSCMNFGKMGSLTSEKFSNVYQQVDLKNIHRNSA